MPRKNKDGQKKRRWKKKRGLDMKKKEKVYHSMAEVEKDFFPVIAKEKRDEEEQKCKKNS
jgi:hypothetical protein